MNYPKEKKELYVLLKEQMSGLIDGVPYQIANLANVSALLGQALKEINWVGFYLLEGEKLILGPFQGKPACIEIPVGKGVCGIAVEQDAIQRVEDVYLFPGHIACDEASRSEIVIPLHANDEVIGVLDIDSPVLGRFTEDDEEGLAALMQVLERYLYGPLLDRKETI